MKLVPLPVGNHHKICYFKLKVKKNFWRRLNRPSQKSTHLLLLYECHKFNGITSPLLNIINDVMNLQITTSNNIIL